MQPDVNLLLYLTRQEVEHLRCDLDSVAILRVTVRTYVIMEGAYIASLRTASVSLLAAEELKGSTQMQRDEQEDQMIYNVVVNHEEQYSIWPQDRENPLGWENVGKSGLKVECLAYIKEVWIDMRPLSLRKQMADQQLSSK